MSARASNIDQSDTRSTIAPSLAAPPVGQDAGPRQLLIAAQQAIAARRTGMAQEALERAESRLLDRSVPQGQTNEPTDNGAVGQIEAARHALAASDLVTASNAVQSVLSGLNEGPGYVCPQGSPGGSQPASQWGSRWSIWSRSVRLASRWPCLPRPKSGSENRLATTGAEAVGR